VLNACVLLVGILLGILISLVLGNLRRNSFGNQLTHAVGVFPGNVAEEVIELPKDIRQMIQFWSGAVPAGSRGYWLNLNVLVGEGNPLHGLLL